MASALFNLTGDYSIERGACFSYTFDINLPTGEYDLTNALVSGFLRRKWDGKVGPNFTATILTPPSGIVNMELTASDTAGLSIDEYQHEVYIYPSGQCPLRLLHSDEVVVWGGGNQ